MPVVFDAKHRSATKTASKPDVFVSQEKHQFFHCFCTNPNVRFEGQNNDERIILILRKHPFTQASWIIAALGIFIFPIFFNGILANFLSLKQIVFINLFWYSFFFSFVFLNALSWFFNVGIITNQRILDVDFHGIFSKEETSCSISNIEQVTARSGGFISSFFNFGNLFIQTAGEQQDIEYIKIPNPNLATSIINEIIRGEYG